MTRRIFCMLLAVLMIAGLSLPAFGAEDAAEAPDVQLEAPAEAVPEPTPETDIAGAETPQEEESVESPSPQDPDHALPEGSIETAESETPADPEIRPEQPPPAGVTSGACGPKVQWQLSGTTLTITGTGPMSDYAGKGAWAPWYGRTIISVSIGSGVTSIGNRAFYACGDLRSITIPETVTRIGADAFEGCVSLERLTLPPNLTVIGARAFYQCASLGELTIPNTVSNLGNDAFAFCTALRTATISSRIRALQLRSFAGCTSLRSVTIPDSVTTIEDSVFDGCSSLAAVTLPARLTKLGSSAFQGCEALKSVTIPASLGQVGDWAFADCTSLAAVTFAGENTGMGERSFSNTPWAKAQGDFMIVKNTLVEYQGKGGRVTIPNSVTAIGSRAFANCTALTGMTIPSSVTTIGEGAFTNTRLAAAIIPNSVTAIGGQAFSDNPSLRSVQVAGSVKTIGESAFWACTNLTDVYLANGVTTLGNYAFADCSSLTELLLPASVTSVGVNALPAGIVIYGYAGSAAQSFAQAGGYTFKIYDGTMPSTPAQRSGWVKVGDKHSFYSGGEPLQNMWLQSARGIWYYMDETGYMVTGLCYVPARKGSFSERTGKYDPSGTWPAGWYYFETADSDVAGRVRGGRYETQFGTTLVETRHNGRYGMVTYTDQYGYGQPPRNAVTGLADGWQRLEAGGDYYFFDNGVAVTNAWVRSQRGIWYYHDENGVMATGPRYVPASQGNYVEYEGFDPSSTWPAGWYYFETAADSDAVGRVRGGEHMTRFGRTMSETRHNGRYGMITYTEMYGYGQPPKNA